MPGGGGRIDSPNINAAVVAPPPRKKAAKKAADTKPATTDTASDKAS
jgi:hypothetical protein